MNHVRSHGPAVSMPADARADALRQGRAAAQRRAWRQAYEHLASANSVAPLAIADLELLAAAASLIGKDEESADLWARAYHQHVTRHDAERAARCAFWIVLDLLNAREQAQASGWLMRSQRLLDDGQHDCPERGLLLALVARLQAMRGDLVASSESAAAASALAQRFADPDLKAFGLLTMAQAHARTGDGTTALALFDEIMVAITASEVSPIGVGTLYCAVIDGCHSLLDVERAREWTAALSRWCNAQPELVRFQGQCLVDRAEILRLSGDWAEAAREAEQLCAVADSQSPSLRTYVGAAFYELAEIHRVRGRFVEAEDAYHRSADYGRLPEPGLALLRLAQRRPDVAAASIRRVLDERLSGAARARSLAAAVEIMITVRDITAARIAAAELRASAESSGGRFLRALSAQATGSVALADGEARTALTDLRAAWVSWQELEVPYEAARVRVLLAQACRALGDHDAAELELQAAARVFQRLGARPDIAHVAALLPTSKAAAVPVLTPRELQVIKLVAGGKTNRAIARQLTISERTVDRHVANILRKLDLSTRSAATAYAYDHGLV